MLTILLLLAVAAGVYVLATRGSVTARVAPTGARPPMTTELWQRLRSLPQVVRTLLGSAQPEPPLPPLLLLEQTIDQAVEQAVEPSRLGCYAPRRLTFWLGSELSPTGVRRAAHLSAYATQYARTNPPDTGWAETPSIEVRIIADPQLEPDMIRYAWDFEEPTSIIEPAAAAAAAAVVAPELLAAPQKVTPTFDYDVLAELEKDLIAGAATGSTSAAHGSQPAGRPIGDPTQELLDTPDNGRPGDLARSSVAVQAPATPTARLVQSGQDPAPLLTSRTCTVCRLEDNDIVIGHPKVSARHCQLIPGPTWHLLDVGSRNHTSVNGSRLAKGVPHPLADGDTVRLANEVVLTFRVGAAAS